MNSANSLENINARIDTLTQEEIRKLEIQRDLYDRFVLPEESRVFEIILSARNGIDALYHRKREEQFINGTLDLSTKRGIQNLVQYPSGFCRERRDYIFEKLQKIGIFDRFEASGGKVQKRVLARKREDNNTHYQVNVLQVGDRMFDHDGEESSQRNLPIQKESFLNPNSDYREFDMDLAIDVAVNHHRDEVFESSAIFGGMSLFFPLIQVNSNGKIDIIGNSVERLDNFTEKKYLQTKKWILENNTNSKYSMPEKLKKSFLEMINWEIESPYSLEESKHRYLSRSEFDMFLQQVKENIQNDKGMIERQRMDFIEGGGFPFQNAGHLYLLFLRRLLDLYTQHLIYGTIKNPYKAKVQSQDIFEPHIIPQT
ncbi:hypothetical protein CSB09_02075 [Candidatus Gracilibacteria bacterium]|nr:MAG: hypothetical protein CSB09_02075 [Candidatus Gracilibacteria bacterium]